MCEFPYMHKRYDQFAKQEISTGAPYLVPSGSKNLKEKDDNN
jgi:hypothetical protein